MKKELSCCNPPQGQACVFNSPQPTGESCTISNTRTKVEHITVLPKDAQGSCLLCNGLSCISGRENTDSEACKLGGAQTHKVQIMEKARCAQSNLGVFQLVYLDFLNKMYW